MYVCTMAPVSYSIIINTYSTPNMRDQKMALGAPPTPSLRVGRWKHQHMAWISNQCESHPQETNRCFRPTRLGWARSRQRCSFWEKASRRDSKRQLTYWQHDSPYKLSLRLTKNTHVGCVNIMISRWSSPQPWIRMSISGTLSKATEIATTWDKCTSLPGNPLLCTVVLELLAFAFSVLAFFYWRLSLSLDCCDVDRNYRLGITFWNRNIGGFDFTKETESNRSVKWWNPSFIRPHAERAHHNLPFIGGHLRGPKGILDFRDESVDTSRLLLYQIWPCHKRFE